MPQPGSIALVIAAVTATACSKSVDAPPPAQSTAAPSSAEPAEPHHRNGAEPHHRNGEDKREDRHDPAAAPRLELAVVIDGAPASWGPDAFGKVAKYAGNDKASDGEGREVWPPR